MGYENYYDIKTDEINDLINDRMKNHILEKLLWYYRCKKSCYKLTDMHLKSYCYGNFMMMLIKINGKWHIN